MGSLGVGHRFLAAILALSYARPATGQYDFNDNPYEQTGQSYWQQVQQRPQDFIEQQYGRSPYTNPLDNQRQQQQQQQQQRLQQQQQQQQQRLQQQQQQQQQRKQQQQNANFNQNRNQQDPFGTQRRQNYSKRTTTVFVIVRR
jgi:hypothetical protein